MYSGTLDKGPPPKKKKEKKREENQDMDMEMIVSCGGFIFVKT